MTPFEQGFLDELDKIAQMLARLAKGRRAAGVVKNIPGLERMTAKELLATPSAQVAHVPPESITRSFGSKASKDIGEATTLGEGLSVSPEGIVEAIKRYKELRNLPPLMPPRPPAKLKFIEVPRG